MKFGPKYAWKPIISQFRGRLTTPVRLRRSLGRSELALPGDLWSLGGVVKWPPNRLKIGFQACFGPNFTVEFEAFFQKKFGQAYCPGMSLVLKFWNYILGLSDSPTRINFRLMRDTLVWGCESVCWVLNETMHLISVIRWKLNWTIWTECERKIMFFKNHLLWCYFFKLFAKQMKPILIWGCSTYATSMQPQNMNFGFI